MLPSLESARRRGWIEPRRAGACSTHESFPNRLEARLRVRDAQRSVEVWNAGCSNYSLYNYLGTLERLAHLAPDVFVVVVHGGNDFSEAAPNRWVRRACGGGGVQLYGLKHRRAEPDFKGGLNGS